MAGHDRSASQAQSPVSVDMPRPCAPGARPHALTVAIASALGMTALPVLAQTAITLDTNPLTKTATTVTTTGSTTKVTTATTSGANAFNSFSTFKVGAGDTVNLHLPTGASNLINLVWDEQVSINGLLNSYTGNNGNQIGGRVFFAAPNGFVVGSTGVLNVGALAIATPRADEMLLLGSEIGTGGAATDRLLKGQLATADATVDIAGRINALDDVRIQARAIDVSGTIFVEGGTGADKLDSQVAVNTGAPVGTRLVQDGNNILLVAQDAVLGGDASVNLKAGSTLRANGGDVIVQSDDALTTRGVINTRRTAADMTNPGAGAASTGDSGDVTLAGRILDIGGTVDASATAGRTAGDIDVQARARDGVPFGKATAESSATVRGTLKGRDVSVTAESTASSDWEFDPNKPEEVPEIAIESLSNALGALGIIDVGYLHATSKATVDVTGTASLQASRDVILAAKTVTSVQTKASTKGNGLNNNLVVAGIGAAYGELDAAATVNVASGATIGAGNDVSIGASTVNTLTVSAITLTTGTQPIAATVAISDAQIDAKADVAKGAVITGRNVKVTAHNESDFKTTAKATSDEDGQVGIAGAVSLQNVNATATNAADMSGIVSLTVDATSHTGANITGAKTAVGKSGFRILMAQKKADAQLALLDRMTKGYGSRSGLIGQQSQGSGETKDFRLGSSLSYVDATHTANATIADTTSVNASGAVTVSAKVEDEGISQVAGAGVASKAKEKNGSDVSISAAMNFGQYRHDANARIGNGASITADTVSVLGTVHLPLGISRSDLDDIGTFFSTIDDVILGEQDELTPLDLSKPITSMVSAKAKGEKLALGGAVNYMETTNRATAWVDDGATINARAVDVKALTDIVSVHIAGKPSPTGSPKGSAVGGTFNDVIYDNTTLAGIGANTVVNAGETVAVDAQSRSIGYIVALTAGTAQDEAIAGMVTIADTSDVTHASISNDARVTAARVGVSAVQDDLLVSAAGAFSKSEEAGIGLSVAVNNRSSDTRAFIGDNSKDATTATGVAHVAPTTVDGFIATDALDVGAQTRGMSVALSIAGAVSKNEDPNKPKGEPGFLDKLKKSVADKKKAVNDAATNAFTQVPGLNSLFGKAAGAKPLAASAPATMTMARSSQPVEYTGPMMSTGLPPLSADEVNAPPKSTGLPPVAGASSTLASASAADGGAGGTTPKFGLSVSGSASVNMAQQVTVASVDGATVRARTPAGTQSTTVQALNSAELASASGAVAVTRAKSPGGKFNAALAGAVAYGLIDNTTQATVSGSTLSNVDDLAVRALNVGEHTAIGISVGAEVSGGSSTSTSFSGSFSIARIDNDTSASVDGSTVTGADIDGSSVDVTAYDRSRIGIGGGSLYVNTSTGSNANVGAAFTYAATNNATHAGLSGGSVAGIDAFTLRAIDSTLIGSAAAMGGGGSQANGLAGAVVWNEIANRTTATVDGGAVVTVDGDIAVSARASAPVTALDNLVAGGIHDGSGYDFSGSTLFANSSSAIPAGSSIISVAGLVQAGKNNIGLSFVGSNVANTHEVSIDSATLNAGTNRVDLDASDNTAIISATVGVGVASGEFAGLGSATANLIGNTSRVTVNNAAITAGTLDAQARDDSAIYSLAGNVTVSKATAAGAAVSYNKLDNTVESLSTGSTLNAGTIGFGAQSHGDVLAGAVAGAVGKEVAVGGSFGWTESSNAVTAAIDGGSLAAGTVTVHALNDTTLRTLSGSVGVGKDAGIGAAFNTVLIEDTTTARLDGSRLAATGDVVVKAEGTGEAQSLAVAGAASQGVAVSGSNSNSIVNNQVHALAQNLRGATGGTSAATARTLQVGATSTMAIDSLAGAVAGAQSAAVGGAVSVNVVGGSTTATLAESVLGVTHAVDVKASSESTIDTLAVAGAGAAQGAFTGAATTNFITSTVRAAVRDTGSVNSAHTLTVSADDASRIQSLAGAAGVAGKAGVGASIAVNRVATTVDAAIEGGDDARQYRAGEVVVSATGGSLAAGAEANIRTVAIGVGGGGTVGGAGSLAINLLDNDVKARIANGANVLSNNNVAVTADNRQGIDVLAGSVAFGGAAVGVGIGLVVNDIRGETIAEITGASTQVSALAQGAGRSVNDNELADPSATDVSDITAIADYTAPDLSVGSRTVNGVAVNALNRQHVATAAGGAAFTVNPKGSVALTAVTGTNVIGGTTRATIDGAKINQATGAAADQAVDVRAGSHAVNANFIAGVAGGGSVGATGAIATNVFSNDTEASIVGATTAARGGVSVDSVAGHNSVALSVGLAGALVGGAGSASLNVFDTRNRAFVTGGTLGAGSLFVDADTVNRVNLISGAGAVGGVGVAGSFLVNVGSSDTYAYVGDAGDRTIVNVTGALDVDASSHSVMKGVAVSGAAGGAAGVAGMASVSVLANATRAWVQNATTTSATLDVSAKDTLDLQSYAGALGLASGGHGVGAAANVAVLANATSAQIVDSTTTSTGGTRVDATSERKLDAVTVTAGVGGSTGIGGSASLLLVGLGDRGDSGQELDRNGTGTLSKVGELSGGNRVDASIGTSALSDSERDSLNSRARFDLGAALAGADDTTSAGIANSTVRAATVDVDADSKLGIRHITGAGGAGAVGLGGAFAYTGVYDATRATITGSTVSTTATGGDAVRVEATSGDLDGQFRAGDARAYAGGAGIVGLGAAIAVVNVDRTTAASAGGTFTGASGTSGVSVSARDSSSVKADATGAAAGAASAGIVVSTAKKLSDVSATIAAGSTLSGYRSLAVDARSSGAVGASGIGAAAGLLYAGTGVGVTATDESVVRAASGGAVSLTGGDAAITASATPDVDAESLGVAVGGNAGLGASVALAKASADVGATMTGTLSGTGNLSIGASIGRASADADSARATSVAGSGGVLLGANASVAEATNSSKAVASTGDNARLSNGNVSVTADVDTRQSADSTGVAVGALALGASVSKAASNTETTAKIGASNRVTGDATAGNVAVRATGTDRNIASSTAGAGGVVSGNASRADTASTSTTTASVGDGTHLRARKIDVSATHDSRYAGKADSLNASFVGASGAGIGHVANATVNAAIGAGSNLGTIDDIRVTAQNRFHSDNTGASVSAAGGGVLNGSAALVDVALNGTANASVGNGAKLATGLTTGANGRAGDIHVIASTVANTADSAELATGGAIDVAVVKAKAAGNFTNNVSIGDNATLDTYGYINVGTYTQADMRATALVNTWGLAAVGVSDSDVDVVTGQNVTVGTGASLEAFRNVYVTAGRDSRNLHDTRLNAESTSQGYVRGLIAVPNSSAQGHTRSDATTWAKSGSDLTSTSNVTLGSYTGSQQQSVDGTGHGYQLGFIPVTQRDSSSGSAGTGRVTLDGAATAGRYNTLAITIDANGTLRQTDGLPVDVTSDAAFNPRAYLDSISCGGDTTDGCKGLTALKNSVANTAIGAWKLGPMFAGGGDVFLHGDAITGSGSATAKGAPSITVTNNSNRALLLDEITLPDYSGGNVRFTGTAGTAGAVKLTQAPSTAKPTVTIHNAGTASNPGAPIFLMGDVRNLGGLVRVRNDQGSLGQFATIYAQQQIVEAPNGIVTFNNLGRDWTSGSNPRSDWLGWGRPSSPNDVVAYIVNDVFNASGSDLIYLPGVEGQHAGRSITPWGGCKPHNDNSGCGAGGYPFGYINFRYDGDGGDTGIDMPNTPHRALYRSAGYGDNPAVANNAAGSSFVGQQIYVRARYIDVNSTIDAGAGTNWSLQIKSEMQSWIDSLGANAQGLYDIPAGYVSTIDGGSRLITARYDATNRRIVVDNVNASGGGYVYLDGRIVSSTPHGKIKVSSGYGKVTIDSAVGASVEVNDINVGNGAVGVVEIVDRQKAWVGGNPYTTWYVSRQGQGTRAYDNSNGATSYEGGVQLSNAGTYNPQAGMRFGWTESARVARADYKGQWGWVDAQGGRVDDGQQWTVSDGGYYLGTAGGPAFEQNISGNFQGYYDSEGNWHYAYTNSRISYGCSGQYGGCNFGFPALPGGNEWNPSRNDGKGGWQTIWSYYSPLSGSITLSNSVKADNAIAIDFSGNAIGSVDVKAQGNLLLNGRVSNAGGTTTLTTVASAGGQGHITRNGDTATVTTRDLKIVSAGGLGLSTNPFEVTLTEGGSLDAATAGWGQHVRLLSGGAVRMIDSGFGTIVLDANGSVTGINGAARDFAGGDITLTSRFGSLGTLSTPLDIEARELSFWGLKFGGRVNANALGDIALTDHSGDFAVNKVVSETGNVRLEAASGSLVDARARTGTGVLDEAQRQAIWGRLKLDGSGVAASVQAYEQQVVARYQEYWRLLDVGTVDNGAYTLNAGAIALFRPLAEAATGRTGLTDAEINAYAAGRYDDAGATFASAIGADWRSQSAFQTKQSNFAFTLDPTSTQYQDLARNATWTQGQLKYAINANALEPASGAVTQADPNVQGRNVTLVARDNVGRLAADRNIGYAALTAGTISDNDAVALALANAPGDVVLVRGDGHVYTRAELLALTTADIANGAIAMVRVKQTSPLVVQLAGVLNGSAGQAAYLQANGDLAIERFTTVGDARIAATGSIASGRSDTAASLIVGGDLVLLAGNGRIGASTSSTSNDPLVAAITGRLLSASAGQDVRLRDTAGDLHLGTVFANGTIGLESQSGSIVSVLDGLALDGQSIELKAAGDIGHRTAASGALDGALRLRVGATGALNGSATGSAWIDSPDRALQIGTFTTGGALRATAAQHDLVASNLDATGNLTLGAGGNLSVGAARTAADAALTAIGDVTVGTLDAANAGISAGADLRLGTVRASGAVDLDSVGATTIDANGRIVAASIDLDAASLAMGAGSSMNATGDITIDTAGDMTLGALALDGNAAGSDIVLRAGGRIEANGDGQTNVRGGSANTLDFLAGRGVGAADNRLAIDIGRTTGRATSGDIHLALPQGGRIDRLVADAGSIDVASAAGLDLGVLEAFGTLRLASDGDLVASTLQAGTDLVVDAAGAVDVVTAQAGHDLAVNAGGSLAAGTLRAGRDATLVSGADLSVDHAVIGRDLVATSDADLALDLVDAGGDTRLRSAGDTALGALDAASLDLNAGARLDAARIGITGKATLDVGTSLAIDGLAVGGALQAHVGGDAGVRVLQAGSADLDVGGALAVVDFDTTGNASLVSSGATSIDRLTVGGDLVADAGATLSLMAATVAGDATLSGAQDIVLGTAAIAGALDAAAGHDLRIDRLETGGDARLDAGHDLALTDATLHAALSARAGNNLRIDRAAVAGGVDATSGAASAIGDLRTGGDATIAAGTTIDAQTLVIGGHVALTSGQSTTVATLDVGGALAARAGTALRLDTVAVTGGATLDAGDDVLLGNAAVGDLLAVHAGRDIVVSALAVGGDATLDAAQDIALGNATVGGTLDAAAGRDLAALQLDVANDTRLVARDVQLGAATVWGQVDIDARRDLQASSLLASGAIALDTQGTVSIDTVRTDASLTARAGDAMRIGTLATGVDAHLDARTLAVADATVGRALVAGTAGDLRIDVARVGTDATLRAGGDIELGSVAAGKDIDADATGTLRFADLDAGRDVALTTEQGDVLGGRARAGQDLRITSARRIDVDTLEGARDITLSAGADIDAGEVTAGRNVDAQAATDLAMGTVTAGQAVMLDAGEAMRLARVRAGTDLALMSGADLAFGALDAGRDIGLRSRRGDVTGDTLTAGGNAALVAARDVRVGSGTVGGTLEGTAGRDLAFDRYDVNGAVVLQSGRDMRIGSGASGGTQALLVGSNLGFGTLSSTTGLTLDATGGRIDGDLLVAPEATVSARDAIALDMARIGSRLNMASASIDANVAHTGSGVLATRLTGYRDGVARRIDLSVDARDGWLMERLAALQAELDTTASNVAIADGRIEETMRLDTRDARLWMDNLGATLRIADVQFMELDKRFQLVQSGVHSLTDAYVVRFSPGYRVEVPNYVASHDPSSLHYLGESALRYTVRTLSGDVRSGDDVTDAADRDRQDVVTTAPTGAVNTGTAP